MRLASELEAKLEGAWRAANLLHAGGISGKLAGRCEDGLLARWGSVFVCAILMIDRLMERSLNCLDLSALGPPGLLVCSLARSLSACNFQPAGRLADDDGWPA